jgi:hypothetical protein
MRQGLAWVRQRPLVGALIVFCLFFAVTASTLIRYGLWQVEGFLGASLPAAGVAFGWYLLAVSPAVSRDTAEKP